MAAWASLALLLGALAPALGAAVLDKVVPGDDVRYVGAVLEYEPFTSWGEGQGDAILGENTRAIVEYAATAKSLGADIMVTPEYGLQGLDMHELHPQEMLSLTQHVPNPADNVVPCTSTDDLGRAEHIRALSCAALENELYLVVDVAEAVPCEGRWCPPSGSTLYNSQVVFDRQGAVIARYRKKNLYLEWAFTPGDESDDTAIYTTDFGVTFSTQVCFDIAFYRPGVSNLESHAHIRDVTMATAWVDVMPFTIAPSVQNGWSRQLATNLLVSGYHLPERAKMGSGIYRGASDLAHYISYGADEYTKLVVAEVDTVASVEGVRPMGRVLAGEEQPRVEPRVARRDHLLIHDDLTNYTQVEVTLNGDNQIYMACHDDGLCCNLNIPPSPPATLAPDLTYLLVAYSGVVEQGYGTYRIYNQICGVVWCRSRDHTTCGRLEDGLPSTDAFPPFSLQANFSIDHVFPVLFDRHLHVADNDQYDYTCTDRSCRINVKTSVPDLMSGGMYGRWYDRDP